MPMSRNNATTYRSGNVDQLEAGPSLADKLTDALRDAVLSNRYPAGSALPTEATVAREFGVGRTTVREAISRLKHEGLISTRRGSGAYVAHPEQLDKLHLATPDLARPEELHSMIELLIAVEAAAAGMAARRRTPEQLEAISTALANLELAVREGEDGVEADFQFHRAIYVACGNPLFLDLSYYLDGRLRSLVRKARVNSERVLTELEDVLAEHRLIAKAIAAGSEKQARNAAEHHLSRAELRLHGYLQRIAKGRSGIAPSATLPPAPGRPDQASKKKSRSGLPPGTIS